MLCVCALVGLEIESLGVGSTFDFIPLDSLGRFTSGFQRPRQKNLVGSSRSSVDETGYNL